MNKVLPREREKILDIAGIQNQSDQPVTGFYLANVEENRLQDEIAQQSNSKYSVLKCIGSKAKFH